MIRTSLWVIFISFLIGFGCFGHDPKHGGSGQKSSDDFEVQVKFFKARLEDRPGDPVSLSKLGVLYLNRARETGAHEDYALAEERFRNLVLVDRDSKTGAIGLSYALLGQHRFAEALHFARRVADRHPGDTQILALMGDLHFALGNYPEAGLFFRRIHEIEPSFESLTRMAQIAEIQGEPTLAVQHLTKSLELAESQELPAHQRAWCHTMLGDLETQYGGIPGAREHYRKALALEPEMHYADWQLARLALAEEKLEDAESHVTRAVHHGGQKPAYLFTKGWILLARGKHDAAEPWFSKGERHILEEIVAGDIGHLRELASHWLDRRQNIAAALSLANRDLQEVRHDPEAYELAGWALHLSGRHEEASVHMNDALKTGWANSRTLLRAGIVSYKAGAMLQARQRLHQGLQGSGMVDPALRAEAEALLEHLQANPEELLRGLTAAKDRDQ